MYAYIRERTITQRGQEMEILKCLLPFLHISKYRIIIVYKYMNMHLWSWLKWNLYASEKKMLYKNGYKISVFSDRSNTIILQIFLVHYLILAQRSNIQYLLGSYMSFQPLLHLIHVVSWPYLDVRCPPKLLYPSLPKQGIEEKMQAKAIGPR